VRLEDDVFVGPNATFTNDLFPRSRQRPAQFARTIVRRGASIGANATILAGLEIGEGAMVGAGAVVTHDVRPGTVVVGNPARELKAVPEGLPRPDGDVVGCGATRVSIPVLRDDRGALSFAEYGAHLPFRPLRYFVLFDLTHARGGHAHRALHQFLVCLHGSCDVRLEHGDERASLSLTSPATGLHVPPMIWTTVEPHSRETVVLVLASDRYDEADYIRDHTTFRGLTTVVGA
jgi:hypothetical protein